MVRMLRSIIILSSLTLTACGPGMLTSRNNSGYQYVPISRVQGTGLNSFGAVSSLTNTFTAAPAIGNLIVVFVTWTPGATPNFTGVTDNWGNTYVIADTILDSANKGSAICYTIVQSTGNPFIVTSSTSTSANFTTAAVEFAGIRKDSQALDKYNHSTAATVMTGAVSTPSSTSQNNELVVTMVETSAASNQTFTQINTGYFVEYTQPTCTTNAVCSNAMYNITNSVGIYTMGWNWTTSSNYSAIIATFRGM